MSHQKDTLRLVTHHEEPLPTHDTESAGEDEYAALADLFLSGSEPEQNTPRPLTPPSIPEAAPRPTARPLSDRRRMEALIVGHLPVMGSAWVRQHARQTAIDLGRPVALLRISAGHATLDIFGDASTIEDAIPAADLDAGIRTAALLDPHWMVRTDAVAEPSLARADRIARLTLLTGADEAAIVSAYRAIKSIVNETEQESDEADDLLSVVIMGADPDQATDAKLRIRRACDAFLGRTLDVRPGTEQIHPGTSTTVFRGETTVSLDQAVKLVTSPPSLLTPQTAEPKPAKPAPAQSELAQTRPAAPVRPARRPHREPESVSPPKPAVEVRRSQPKTEPAFDRVPPITGNTTTVASPDGLEHLADACPVAPSVRLATDLTGTVYLIAEANEQSQVDRAAAELQSAVAWYRSHAALLGTVARRSLKPDPIARLVTREASWVKDLLDAGIDIRLRVPPAPTDTLVPLNTQRPDAG